MLGFSMIYRLTDRFSFSPAQIGTYLALGQFFYFLGCNLYHRFGYAYNPVRIFSAAAALVFLAALPMSFGSRALVYVSYWILQIGAGLFWPPIMAHLTSGLNEKELNREISYFNRSWMAGLLVGPLISGNLYNWNSSANFIVLSLSYFIALIILLLRRRSHREEWEEPSPGQPSAASIPAAPGTASPVSENREKSPVSKVVDKRLDNFRYRGYIGAFCSSMVMGVIINIIPLHIRDGLGYTERLAGMILFFRCAAGFIGFSVLARFSSWHFNRRWFIILQGSFMICVLLFMTAGSNLFILTAIIFLCGFINSSCYNNSMFYSGVTGRNPKKNMALHEIVLSMGNALGTAGGGFLYQHYNIIGVCLVLFLALVAGMGLLVFFNRKSELNPVL